MPLESLKENRIIEARVWFDDATQSWFGSIKKEFTEANGGGVQEFVEVAVGPTVFHALDNARAMVTLHPATRTDKGVEQTRELYHRTRVMKLIKDKPRKCSPAHHSQAYYVGEMCDYCKRWSGIPDTPPCIDAHTRRFYEDGQTCQTCGHHKESAEQFRVTE